MMLQSWMGSDFTNDDLVKESSLSKDYSKKLLEETDKEYRVELLPTEATMAQFALRWILMFDAVSTVIPGGKTPSQVADNASAADLPPLTSETMRKLEDIYNRYARRPVHHRW